ncbi:MAG: hypothetical protein J0665_17575 [Deltaproteobacteria bacterium]|nr:hypothetical protein [Deltaproteobacteria bacterium]
MFHDPLLNQRGMGLIMAVFIIVVVAMFGVLIARYSTISSVTSAEDILWAQALYSAESTIRLNILHHDGGGNLSGSVEPMVGGLSTDILADTYADSTQPATIKVLATRVVNESAVSRTLEAKYVLSSE